MNKLTRQQQTCLPPHLSKTCAIHQQMLSPLQPQPLQPFDLVPSRQMMQVWPSHQCPFEDLACMQLLKKLLQRHHQLAFLAFNQAYKVRTLWSCVPCEQIDLVAHTPAGAPAGTPMSALFQVGLASTLLVSAALTAKITRQDSAIAQHLCL